MKNILIALTVTSCLAGANFAAAQSANYKDQQGRIAQGVKSGQLTPRETSSLESREHAINKQALADRRANGGQLTSPERAQIHSERQGTSQRIYADKHNPAQDHFGNSEVGRRQQNQQRRVAQGIGSGRMNAREASNVERRSAGVNSEIRADRSMNGGRLTQGERRSVNRQQNRISRTIYRDKHN
jgi:hypothetical protein